MKTLGSNWINILGVFLAVFIYSAIAASNLQPQFNILQACLSALISVALYGVMFWALFLLLLLVLDLLLLAKNKKNLNMKLFAEWLMISTPFVYWAVKYSQWVFIVGVISFMITQVIRRKSILTTDKPLYGP